MFKKKLPLILASFFVLSACSVQNQASLSHSSERGAVKFKSVVSELKRGRDIPEGERPKILKNQFHKVENIENEFSAKIDSSLLRDKSDGLEFVSKRGQEGNSVRLDKTQVYFKKEATPEQIEQFKQDFGVSLRKTEVEGLYMAVFNFDKIKLESEIIKKKSEALKYTGEVSFSSEKMLKAFQQVLIANDVAEKYNLGHVGLDVSAKIEDEGNYYEGGGTVSPSSTFWYHNSPYTSMEWGDNIHTTSDSTYNYASGAGIKVGVIDSGFLAPGESATSYNSAIFGLLGTWGTWSVSNQNYVISTNYPGHGRRVASVMFSGFNDYMATSGISAYAQPYLIEAAPYLSDRTSALQWANQQNLKIINCSWAISRASLVLPPTSVALYTQVKMAYDAGRIIVAAAGNNGNGEYYPAAYSEVISVSAHDVTGGTANISGASNANEYYVDVWASGKSIVTADNTAYPSTGVSIVDGTSYAAPLVAGALALYVEQGKVSNRDSAYTKLYLDGIHYTVGGLSRTYLDVIEGLKN